MIKMCHDHIVMSAEVDAVITHLLSAKRCVADMRTAAQAADSCHQTCRSGSSGGGGAAVGPQRGAASGPLSLASASSPRTAPRRLRRSPKRSLCTPSSVTRSLFKVLQRLQTHFCFLFALSDLNDDCILLFPCRELVQT